MRIFKPLFPCVPKSRRPVLPAQTLSVLLLSLLGALLGGSVSPPAPDLARGVYVWKTTWDLPADKAAFLDSLRIRRIYLRVFDIVPNKNGPNAVIRFAAPATPFARFEFVPVVFIRNDVFRSLPRDQIRSLARKAVGLINRIVRAQGLTVTEIQWDCDWTRQTRAAYFSFLEAAAREDSAHRMSATIRLHQVKYRESTGVPPVSAGMLMFYNMGELGGARMSIYNREDAVRYVSRLGEYPLPLDLALPVFSWHLHRRSGALHGLIEGWSRADIESCGIFRKLSPEVWEATRSSLCHGTQFHTNDRLVEEAVSPSQAQEAAALALGSMRLRTGMNAVLFDLNSKNLEHYTNEQLEGVFGGKTR